MAERRKVRGQGGAVVYIDIDRDVDQRTFDAYIERGDWELVEDDEPKKAVAKKAVAKKAAAQPSVTK